MADWVKLDAIKRLATAIVGPGAIAEARGGAEAHSADSFVWSLDWYAAAEPPDVVAEAIAAFRADYTDEHCAAVAGAAAPPSDPTDALYWAVVNPAAGIVERLEAAEAASPAEALVSALDQHWLAHRLDQAIKNARAMTDKMDL